MESYLTLNHRAIFAYGIELAAILQALVDIEHMEKRDVQPSWPEGKPFFVGMAHEKIQRCLPFWDAHTIYNHLQRAQKQKLVQYEAFGAFAIDRAACIKWEERF